MSNSLEIIKKQFMCCVPLQEVKFQEVSSKLTNWDFQADIINQTVNYKQVLEYPIKITYQKNFIKYLINFLSKQNADINDVVYDALGRLMALEEPQQCYKHYLMFGGKNIILKENSSIISEGTTGLCTWQASLALSEWSVENKTLFEDKSVLELGSGVGLLGLVITKLCKVKKYIFTDCHNSVLNNLCENIKLNLNPLGDIKNETVLLSGSFESKEINVINLPWELVNLGTKQIYEADIAIAADVVFDKELFSPLCHTFEFLLKHGNCSAIFLACTERNRNTLREFLNLLGEYSVEPLRTPSPNLFYWSDTVPIKIFKISHYRT